MSEKSNELMVSIQELNSHIRKVIKDGFKNSQFKLVGTVARIFESQAGHIYLDLVDDQQHSLSCTIYQNNTKDIGFTITRNMIIEVVGVIGFYEKDSKVQVEVEGIRLIEHAAIRDFEKLKAELKSRKLWPKPTIRKIPKKIRKIALISGYKSAAIADFYKNYQRSGGKAEIVTVEVPLQGDRAPREIANAIRRLNHEADVVSIVLARGGGRPVDLGVFDDLLVAEAILESKIPILTAIGHEEDNTFADEASDMSGGTPSTLASMLAQYEFQAARSALQMQVIIGLAVIITIALIVFVVITSGG